MYKSGQLLKIVPSIDFFHEGNGILLVPEENDCSKIPVFIPIGSIVMFLEQEGSFVKVLYKNHIGWLMDESVKDIL